MQNNFNCVFLINSSTTFVPSGICAVPMIFRYSSRANLMMHKDLISGMNWLIVIDRWKSIGCYYMVEVLQWSNFDTYKLWYKINFEKYIHFFDSHTYEYIYEWTLRGLTSCVPEDFMAAVSFPWIYYYNYIVTFR